MNFGALTLNITANIQGLSTKLNQASAQVNSFAASMRGVSNITADLNKQTMQYGFNISSVKRIVSGIVIAQVFYKALGAIQDSVSATFEFASALEYAQMAYTNLFGDVELATEFINVLKDFAATTPFTFSESEKAAKRLLAYGVEYKNVMYVMQGVLAASSMQGDSSKVESISRALGQIYTKGRLMNQEMNQLTEAGIPAWEILQEKIGLTSDQIGNIGNSRIPASVAINALVDGMQERFGNVIEASSKTLTGIFSNIKDNALMIGADVVQPLLMQIKAVADAFGTWLYKLRQITATKGVGGLFEAIVPPEAHEAVRTFIANLMNMWTVIKYVGATAFNILKSALYGAMVAFNMIAPIINIVADIFVRLLYALTNNTTAMRWLTAVLIGAATAFVIFKGAAVGALVVTAVYKAVMLLSRALALLATLIVTNPVLLLLGVFAGGLVGFGIAASGAATSLSNLVKSLTSLGGTNVDDILLPESNKAASDLGKFNSKLDATKDSLDNASDSTKKLRDNANKLKKGLLSFDEVFRLTDNEKGTTGSGGGVGNVGDIGDVGIGDLGGGDAWIPEIGDLSGFGTDFVDGLIESLRNAFDLKEETIKALISGGIGSIIGAVAGGLIGGPIGAAIGALVGAIVGYFWSRLADEIGLTDNQTVAIPIGAVIGAAIGGVLGGPPGALIGAAIGGLVGNIMGLIVDGITTGNWDFTSLSTSLGIGIGAAIGAVVGGPPGALIGAAIGALVGNIGGLLLDGFINGDWKTTQLSTTIGTAIGAAIGLVVGGPPGAVIGAAIGGLVGYVGGLITDGFSTGKWKTTQLSMLIGGGIGAAIGMIVGGPPGALIGGAIGTLTGWIAEKLKGADWSEIWDAFMEGLFLDGGLFSYTAELVKDAGIFFEQAKQAFIEQDWGQVGANILGGIIAGFSAAIGIIIEPIAKFFVGIWNAICKFFGIHSPATKMKPLGANILYGILDGIVGAVSAIPGWIASAGKAIILAISGWFTNIGGDVVIWLADGVKAISGFVTDTWSDIKNWSKRAGGTISDWASNAGSKISGWASAAIGKISTWAGTTAESIKSWWSNVKGKFDAFKNTSFGTWVSSTFSSISGWASKVTGSIGTWWSNVKSKFDAFKNTSFGTWVSNTASSIGNWASNVVGSIGSWWSNIKGKFDAFKGTSFSTWAADKKKTITDWSDNTWSSIKTWWSNISSKFNAFKGTSFSTWATTTGRTIKNWAEDTWSSIKQNFDKAIAKVKEFFKASNNGKNIPGVTTTTSTTSHRTAGHATGGVFNREHYARFAEGNKAEAIIPLENNSAMQPFVDAVSNGLVSTLGPLLASGSNQEQLQPLYVGTLIADDRGLKELERKMNVIRLQENKRR